MEGVIQFLNSMDSLSAWWVLLVENLVVFILALLFGEAVIKVFKHRRVSELPLPLSRTEIVLTIATLILNTIITYAGWYLWKVGILKFEDTTGWKILLDVVVLFMAMDLAMFVLHRIAHTRYLYRYVHEVHHRFNNPRPLTLFALNPFETLGFGVLWLSVSCVYTSSWAGMMIYLTLNVFFGVIGHVGVEPFPDAWKKIPLLRYISTSTFHAGHHHHVECNYGFYTLIWDKLLGTLAANYEERFGKMQE